MKTFKLKTGLKAGQTCANLWKKHGPRCWDKWEDWGEDMEKGDNGGDPAWAQRGIDIGRSFAGGWF